MAILDERLSYDLPEYMKDGMIGVLDIFPERYETLRQIKLCLSLPGKVVIDSYEAVMLAHLVEPYYSSYGERLLNHPRLVEFRGIPQAYLAAFDNTAPTPDAEED